VSNAYQLSDLSSWIYCATIGGQYGGGASVTVFWSPNLISDFAHATYGIQFGPAFGAGVELGIGASYTWIHELSGLAGAIARGVWKTVTPFIGVADALAYALGQIDTLVGGQC
jgi:hypothetical protein